MPHERAYVFAPDAQGTGHLAGTIDASLGAGSFQYSELWLNARWAYPLDPVNLPLSTKRYRALNMHGLFGVFRDAAPDDWGTRIMLLRHQHAPANELERLIRTSGGGVGWLRFSLSRGQAKPPTNLPTMARLQELARVAEKLEEKQTLAPEELALLEPGSSMGGARPKVTVTDGNERWLVKFSKSGDMVDVPLLEYCSMQFLKNVLKLNILQTRLIQLGEKHAYAVQRFDGSQSAPMHFISANSVFHQDRIRAIEDSKRNPYSYCNLAAIIRKHCANYRDDAKELFTRMLANIVMGNTDDHARNHALVYDIANAKWQLSPAYDMLPIVATQSRVQSMGVGQFGAKASLENALSYANLFGLKEDAAQVIAQQVKSAYHTQWVEFCLEFGMQDADIALVKRVVLA
ncbi:MAG: serine/threonine-protein kinase HipA [Lentisphaeria bacterium]|jgi:serine/threonine-protein kinase HipA